ncbi:hypothetical protein GF406_08675 [candidate division KSB1 bacterium]|nr:hypothetical protein [candidate division KSB1 bacterium]
MNSIAIKATGLFVFLILFTSCNILKKDTFPNRDIKVVIFSSKGGSTDRWSRHLSSIMEKELGVKMICENVPGSLGGKGAMKVWNSPHDGYSVLGSSESSVFFGVNGVAPMARDWEFYIAGGSPGVLAVLKESEFVDIHKLIDTAHQSPGTVSVGNSGLGKLWHIKAKQFAVAAGVEFRHVPFNGSGPAIDALFDKKIDAISCSADEIYDYVRNGKINVLLVNELDGFEFDGLGYVESATELFPTIKQTYTHLFQWIGFMLPADVPNNVKEKFDKAFMSALNSPESKELMIKQKIQWMGVTGKEAKDIILKMESNASWIAKELGVAREDPAVLGIQKITNSP